MSVGVGPRSQRAPEYVVAIKAPTVRQNRRRRALLASGAVAVLSALLGVLAFQAYDTRTSVVVVADSFDRGHVLTRQDLKVVELSGARSINGFDDPVEVVGLIATTSLVEGDVLSTSTTSASIGLDSDESVSGLVLGPGQYPTKDVKPGDIVDILAAGAPDNGGGRRLASQVRIYAVLSSDDVGSRTDLLVSVVLNDTEATEVAAQVEQPGGVRLTLRGADS